VTITLLQPTTWRQGIADGVVRDVRQPIPDDGLLSGAVLRMGDERSGPVVALAIEERRFPRKSPVHLHKSDSFRMALGQPIVVGRTSYDHGEFRLQRADAFYGPEMWTDEVGTNQLLIMADRRGLRPYLTSDEDQRRVDLALADDVSLDGVAMLARDASVDHAITNNFGAELRAGHFDAGFTNTTSWPMLSDGSRVAAIALGDRLGGPLLLCWDRPAEAVPLSGFRFDGDLLRLVVDGSCTIGTRQLGRLGFRLQQAATSMEEWSPGRRGVKELWVVDDRRAWPPIIDPGCRRETRLIVDQLDAEVQTAIGLVTA
jgi:hypothetical protein